MNSQPLSDITRELIEKTKIENFKRNDMITFDEPSHTYFIEKGDTEKIKMKYSITQFIHSFFEKFNSIPICRFMIRSRNFMKKPEHDKYKTYKIWNTLDGMWNETANLLDNENDVIKIITNEWNLNGKKSAELGTKLHNTIETYLLTDKMPDLNDISPINKEFNYFLNYNTKMRNDGFLPYKMESRVFDYDLSIAGSVDMLLVNINDNVNIHEKSEKIKLRLVDWKRSKEIKFKNSKNGKLCCSNIPDCNYFHYSIQLNLYKYLLELHYNIEIVDMYLVILYPDNDDFIEIKVNEMRDKVIEMVNYLKP
jgi:hypothetical protein